MVLPEEIQQDFFLISEWLKNPNNWTPCRRCCKNCKTAFTRMDHAEHLGKAWDMENDGWIYLCQECISIITNDGIPSIENADG